MLDDVTDTWTMVSGSGGDAVMPAHMHRFSPDVSLIRVEAPYARNKPRGSLSPAMGRCRRSRLADPVLFPAMGRCRLIPGTGLRERGMTGSRWSVRAGRRSGRPTHVGAVGIGGERIRDRAVDDDAHQVRAERVGERVELGPHNGLEE